MSTSEINAGLPIEHRIQAAYRDAWNKHRCTDSVCGLLDRRFDGFRQQWNAIKRTIDNPTVKEDERAYCRESLQHLLVENEAYFTKWLSWDSQFAQAQVAVDGYHPPDPPTPEHLFEGNFKRLREGLGINFGMVGNRLTVHPASKLEAADRAFIEQHHAVIAERTRIELDVWTVKA